MSPFVYFFIYFFIRRPELHNFFFHSGNHRPENRRYFRQSFYFSLFFGIPLSSRQKTMLTVCEHVNQVTASPRPEADVTSANRFSTSHRVHEEDDVNNVRTCQSNTPLSQIGSRRHFRHNRGCDISLSSEDGQYQKRFAMSLCQSGDCSPRPEAYVTSANST